MCNWFQNKSPTHTFAVDCETWHCKWAAPCYFNGASPTGRLLSAVKSSVWRTLSNRAWERHLKHSPRRSRPTDRGRVISLPREKRLLDTLESEFDSGSTSNLFDNPGFDIMIATISWRQMHKTIIFCLNLARQLQTNNEQTRTQNRPTCWHLASEVDPHGPSCAVPSGLRFWLAVDHRTNDSSSVCGICEAYYISTRCESLYPKCNRISSNKSMNMTPYSPMYLDGSAILLTCQRTVWPCWLKISPCVTTKIMWSETAFR